MGWRKIQKEDVRRGVLVRFTAMTDTPYNGGTIVSFDTEDNEVTIARPFLYAHEHFNSKTGLMAAEQFTVSLDNLLRETTGIQVYDYWSTRENKYELRSMVT